MFNEILGIFVSCFGRRYTVIFIFSMYMKGNITASVDQHFQIEVFNSVVEFLFKFKNLETEFVCCNIYLCG